MIRVSKIAVMMMFAAAAFAAEEATTIGSVEVTVVDARGNAIRGLTAGDFEVRYQGNPVAITRFEELKQESGAGGRDVLLVFDSSTLGLSTRKASLAAARDFVNRLPENDRARVVAMNATGAANPLSTWTTDRGELLKALDAADRVPPGAMDRDKRMAEQQLEMIIRQNDNSDPNMQGTMQTFDAFMQVGRQYAATAQNEARRNISAFARALQLFEPNKGKPVAVLIGGGLASRPGAEIFQAIESLRSRAAGNEFGPALARGAARANPLSEMSRFEIGGDIRKLASAAKGAGISIYTVMPDVGATDVAAERSGMTGIAETDAAAGVERTAGYQLLARETGGGAAIGRTPADALNTVLASQESRYSLGWTAPGISDAGNLQITTKREGLRVAIAAQGGVPTKDEEIEAAVRAAAAEPKTNEMGIGLAFDPAVAEGENRRIKAKVLIPVKSLKLTQEGTDVVGGFTVYIATNTGAEALGVTKQTHNIRWPAAKLPEMLDKTFGYAVQVVVPPDRKQLSIGVMDHGSQKTGYARSPLG